MRLRKTRQPSPTLCDADAEWPGGFGARTVFAGAAVAEDDAFGPPAGYFTDPRELAGSAQGHAALRWC
jgi:hypothetical protein